ncbi:MAG: hypothetical protein LBI34_02490 [Puniceicoccales bacterium]|jgi:hypothetical protein|nr:hypothetical protein [Puniceicoccales bacterium]
MAKTIAAQRFVIAAKVGDKKNSIFTRLLEKIIFAGHYSVDGMRHFRVTFPRER